MIDITKIVKRLSRLRPFLYWFSLLGRAGSIALMLASVAVPLSLGSFMTGMIMYAVSREAKSMHGFLQPVGMMDQVMDEMGGMFDQD